MTGLAKAGVSALKWGVLATVGRFGLQLIAQVLLARMLGPETYGVFGIGMLVLTLSTFLTNFGFGWNLLHKQDLKDDDVRFAFTWQLLAGGVATIALQLSAAWLADYFHDPRVEHVIRWLSLTCILASAASPATSLTQRALQFKQLGVVQIGSYFAGYVAIGLTLAYLGYGVDALVAAWLTQAAVNLIGVYAIQRHSLKPLLHYDGAGKAFRRGVTVFFNNVVNWWLTNIDRVVLGRMLNPTAVGHYTIAYNLATLPSTMLMSSLQPAFTAAGAQMAQQRERLADAYTQMFGTVAVLVLPFFVALALCAPDLIAVMYGAKWADSGPVLSVLFLGMPGLIIWGVTTPVLTNTGRQHHESLLQLPVLVFAAAAFYLLTTSPVAAAWVALLVLTLRTLAVAASAVQALQVRIGTLTQDLLRGTVLSGAVATLMWGIQTAVSPLGWPLVTLLCCGAGGGALLGGLVLLAPQTLGGRAQTMLIRFVPRLRHRLS